MELIDPGSEHKAQMHFPSAPHEGAVSLRVATERSAIRKHLYVNGETALYLEYTVLFHKASLSESQSLYVKCCFAERSSSESVNL